MRSEFGRKVKDLCLAVTEDASRPPSDDAGYREPSGRSRGRDAAKPDNLRHVSSNNNSISGALSCADTCLSGTIRKGLVEISAGMAMIRVVPSLEFLLRLWTVK